MLVEEAKVKCENDLACGGFTFKGSYKTLTQPMEMYFYHIVPEKTGTDYFYWSTYNVNRKFVKLSKIGMKKVMKHSKKNDVRLHHGMMDVDYVDYVKLTELDIVAFQPQLGIAFSKIDFEDFIVSNNSADILILNLNLKNMIGHFSKIDRCCKLNNRKIEYDGIDNMMRIDCNISKEEFTAKYVNQRETIMMKVVKLNGWQKTGPLKIY